MIALLIGIVGIVHIEVVFAHIRLIVVVAVQSVEVIVGLHVVEQERLLVVWRTVAVAVDVWKAVVVSVLTRENSVHVALLTIGAQPQDIPHSFVRIAVSVIVVLDQVPVDRIVGQASERAAGVSYIRRQEGTHLGRELGIHGEDFSAHPAALEPVDGIEEIGRASPRKLPAAVPDETVPDSCRKT